jgi:hypothetical protein
MKNAGLILSTSGRADVHEWAQLLSGIFSYEVRSGLLGAADLDDDMRITYAELDAFVAAANAKIDNPVARIAPTIRGPHGDANATVVDYSVAGPARVRIDATLHGHAFVHDDSMVRYADFNRRGDRGFWLMLLEDNTYTLVHDKDEYEVDTARQMLALRPVKNSARLGSRGTLNDYYQRHLFEMPLDQTFAEKHWQRDTQPLAPVELSLSETLRIFIAPYVIPYAASTGLLVLGGVAYGGAWVSYALADSAQWADETRFYNGLSFGLSTGGVATLGLGALVAVGTSAALGYEIVSWQQE